MSVGKITTKYNPDVPEAYRWTAVDDGERKHTVDLGNSEFLDVALRGFGETEEEAINDLKRIISERDEVELFAAHGGEEEFDTDGGDWV